MPAPFSRRAAVRGALVYLGLFLAGTAWATWHAQARLDARLPGPLEGRELNVSGYICGVPEPGSFRSVRFPFCVTHWHDYSDRQSRGDLPDRLRLAWYGDEASLQVPSRLKLAVVLKKPHGAINPRGFRYETWLFRQNYGATGTIRAASADPSVVCGVQCRYHRWRADTVQALVQRVAGYESGPMIASLMLGYRGQLEASHWQLLKDTGTIHLVAISGLHLGLVAIGAGFLIRRLPVWLPERWLPPGRLRLAVFSLVCLASLGYALAAGFSVPTRRALIMVVVGCWWVFMSRRGQALDAVLLALVLVLIADPLSPLDQGFWLSFGAVAALTLLFNGRLQPASWWRSLVLAQIAIFAVLWPILALLDQSQPLVGFFANLVAIPLVSLVIMPAVFVCALAMLLLPGLDGWAISGLDQLLQGFWWVLQRASHFSLPDLSAGLPELLAAALVVPLALVLPFRGFRLMAALVVILWSGALAGLYGNRATPENPVVEHPEMWLWDVGQGLSVLIRSEDRVLLYDTGPELEGVYSAVESVLIPNLRALGIHRIDTLVISHADNDHSGGVSLLMEEFGVGSVISGEPERLSDKFGEPSSVAVQPCSEGLPVWPGLTATTWQQDGEVEGNDASCVLALSFRDGGHEVILGGDITAETERAFLAERPEFSARANGDRIVLAPHHGSKTSSSDVWVNRLNPDLVLFSAGYRHRFGHPHPDVVSRYEKAGSRWLNTATSGAIRLTLGSDPVKLTEFRHGTPFWINRYHRLPARVD